MIKKLAFLFAMLITFAAQAQVKSMEDVLKTAPSKKLVHDFTGTLTQLQVDALEKRVVQYDDSTSTQIAIVVVSSTDNYSIEDAAIELGRNWGVGNKDFNNGVVILVAKEDRKITIQSGYGLEGSVTDLTAKSIIDNFITPQFKQDNYYRGLDDGVTKIIEAAAGKYKAPANYAARKKKGGPGTIIIILFIILLIIGSTGGRSGGTYVSTGGFTNWLGGGGSGWSGGGGGGGSGGFGGFGGGSFGGGGASGSW